MATPTKRQLIDFARNAAVNAGIDPDLFVRQINAESGFDPNARSGAGAVGVAQIVPAYHPGVDPTDPFASLTYAANLMGNYVRQYGGDYARALAAYNAGPGAVARYGGVPPFEETQRYVRNILGDAAKGALETGLRATGLIGEGVPVATAADEIMQGPPDAPTGPDIDLGGGAGTGGAGASDLLTILSQMGNRPQVLSRDTGREIVFYQVRTDEQGNAQLKEIARLPKAPEERGDRFTYQGSVYERDPTTGQYREVFTSPAAKLAQEIQLIDRQLAERKLTADQAAEQFDQSYKTFLSEMQRAQEQRQQFETGMQGLNVGLAERGQRLSALDAAQGRFLQALPSQALPGQEFFLGFEPTRGVTGQFSSPAASLFRGLGLSFNPEQFRAPITPFNPFQQVREVLSDFRAPQFNAPALPAPPTPTFTGTQATQPGATTQPSTAPTTPSATPSSIAIDTTRLPSFLQGMVRIPMPTTSELIGAVVGNRMPNFLRGMLGLPAIPAPVVPREPVAPPGYTTDAPRGNATPPAPTTQSVPTPAIDIASLLRFPSRFLPSAAITNQPWSPFLP